MKALPIRSATVVALVTVSSYVAATPPHHHQPPQPDPHDNNGYPVTQTPASSIQTQVASDFDTAFDVMHYEYEPDVAPTPSDAAPTPSAATPASYGVGLNCASFSGRNIDSNYCAVPLSYTIRNEVDPRRRLVLRLPITRIWSEGKSAYNVGFGAAYTYPMTARWYLTPALSYTHAERGDFDKAANLVSASLTSVYYWKMDGYDLGIGNMFGHSRTVRERGDARADLSGTHNNILRNGIMVAVPGLMFGKKAWWEISLVDTRYFGSEIYADSQQEISVTVGDTRSYKATGGGYRAGLTLMQAGKTDGFKLAWQYWF